MGLKIDTACGMWPGNKPADIQPRTPQPVLRKDDNGKLPIWRPLFVIVGTLSDELMGTIRDLGFEQEVLRPKVKTRNQTTDDRYG